MRIDEIFRDITEWGLIVPGVNTTPDVGPDAITKQAAKFGNVVGPKGEVARVSKDSYKKEPPTIPDPKMVGTISPLANGKMKTPKLPRRTLPRDERR